MPTLYTSNLLPSVFTAVDPYSIKNGTAAKSEHFQTVARNQVWLACGGAMPVINFFIMQQNSTNPDTDDFRKGAWTGSARTVPVFVPPFASLVDFGFFAAKDFQNTSAVLAYINIDPGSSTYNRRISHIPVGEDLTTTGKGAYGEHISGKWVWASGLANQSSTSAATDPGALPITTAPTNSWRRLDVEITVSAYCYVRAACYRVHAPTDTYTIST